jgi:arabinogalactan oligomer/maltooligosaccharide transport system permease protein
MSTQLTPSQTPAAEAKQNKRRVRAAGIAEAASGGLRVILLKMLLLAIVDAVALFSLFILAGTGDWIVFAVVFIVTAIVNWIYFSRRAIPAKYLAPGVIFLLVFQVFTAGYTAYVAFTNYGSGHNSTQEDAVDALLASAQQRVPDSPAYDLTVLEQLGRFSFLVADTQGDLFIGTADSPLEPVDASELEDGRPAGYEALNFADIVANQEAIGDISVPISDDPNDGFLRTPDGSKAFVYKSSLVYDEAASTMTNSETGVVYTDNGRGSFESEAGEELSPGWKVEVGFENFARAFGEESIRGPFIYVTIWTIVFAFLSVATTFALGLFLAIVFNDARMRGRKVYRVIMILPYAFPSFLTALVWAGLLNTDFGYVNQVLLGGAEVPWLTNEWLAKFSILLVNLWLGFPYMFLVCTGALQSIPEELQEAGRMDGAGNWAIFRSIKLPLLMVSVAPLLISSFAYNFNNFNLIYVLTNGGPRDVDAGINVGATDILISMVYKVAFVGAGRDFGLASAFSIIIFAIVATISIISFRYTKALEELN